MSAWSRNDLGIIERYTVKAGITLSHSVEGRVLVPLNHLLVTGSLLTGQINGSKCTYNADYIHVIKSKEKLHSKTIVLKTFFWQHNPF